MRSRVSIVALAVGLGAAALGCGGRRIGTDRLEQRIRDSVENDVGLSVASVRCPDEVARRPRGTFTCTVTTTGGDSEPVVVTQRNASFSYRVGPG